MKKIIKYVIIGFIGLCIFAALFGGEDDKVTVQNKDNSNQTITTKKEEPKKEEPKKEEPKKEEPKVSIEFSNALKKAETYSNIMSMSKQGIYDQLTSSHGEKFPKEAAKYAIDNLKADYKQNALKKAKSYQETMSMSKQRIYDQLISKHGEKFTKEEAQYAIDNLNK